MRLATNASNASEYVPGALTETGPVPEVTPGSGKEEGVRALGEVSVSAAYHPRVTRPCRACR